MKSTGNCSGADQGIKSFDWLLQRKKGFDWLLRRKGSRVEKVLIGSCVERDQMGLLGRFGRSNAVN